VELHVEYLLNCVVNLLKGHNTSVVNVTMVGEDVKSRAGTTLISWAGRNIWVFLI
jgi:hypothetical protein